MRIHEFYPYCQRTTKPTENEQPARQFYRQSSTMPPKKAARDQLRLASTRSSTENLRSPLGRVTPILTRRVSVLQEHAIYDRSDHDDEENTAGREDDLRDGLGDNPSAPELPRNPRSRPYER